jgi:hypothetical protein
MALLALLAPLALPPAIADPPAPAPWTVAGTVDLGGSPLVVTANITVAPGGLLRLHGTPVLVAAPGVHIAVQAGGGLELLDGPDPALGTNQPTRVASPSGPFDLEARPGARLRVMNATLQGARLALAAGDVAIEDATLHLDQGPVRVLAGMARISGSELRASPQALVAVEGGALELRDSWLWQSGWAAIEVRSGAEASVTGTLIERSQGYAVRVDGARAALAGDTFRNITDYDLYARGAELELRGTRLEGHCGAFLVEGTRGNVTGSTFATEGHGLSVYDSDALRIAGNRFEGAEQAVLLTRAAPAVEGNAFVDDAEGIVLMAASPHIAGNTFAGGDRAVVIEAGGSSAPVLRGNAFGGSATAALVNPQAQAVDAVGNWWGSPSGPNAGPGSETVQGPALVSPWLGAPP